jgi:DNA primase
LQLPAVAGPQFDVLLDEAFLLPVHRQIRAAIAAAGGCATSAGGAAWIGAVEAAAADEPSRNLINALGVETLRDVVVNQARYADAMIARLQWIVGAREIVTLKARVQRINPLEQPDEYNRAFGELITLEGHVRLLGERAIGGA